MSKVGRPLKFQSTEELQSKIDEYFKNTDCPTITELALHLGTTRETLREYKERPEFVDSIMRALTICEAYVEKGALQNKLNAQFSMFNLKNNYGWRDKSESEVYGKDGKDLIPNPIMDVRKDNSDKQDNESQQKN